MDNLTKLDYTLSVMKRQREKLWKDCLKNDYDLMHGLREEMPEAHKLYCERYRLMWIDAHWNTVTAFAEEYQLSEKERRDLYLYFAKAFRTFLESFSYGGDLPPELFFKFLKKEIQTVEDLITIKDKNKSMIGELKNLQEVHWGEFKKRIEKLKAERQGNHHE